MMEAFDHLFKFLIIGSAGAGKTCIMRRFLDNTFKENSLHTIGVEFSTKTITVGEKRVKLQIWDTAGQERFQCVTRSYYRGAVGALLVYDITNRESFNQVHSWLSSARELAKEGLVVVLLGNKCDLSDTAREVSTSEAQAFADEHKVDRFLETSAKSGDNVAEAFHEVAAKILSNPNSCLLTDASSPALLPNGRPRPRPARSEPCC